jgi:hypothetical protein
MRGSEEGDRCRRPRKMDETKQGAKMHGQEFQRVPCLGDEQGASRTTNVQEVGQ